MEKRKLKIGQVVQASFRDSLSFFFSQPIIVIVTVLCSALFGHYVMPNNINYHIQSQMLLSPDWFKFQFFSVVGIVLLVPAALTIHRVIILSETGGVKAAIAQRSRVVSYIGLAWFLSISGILLDGITSISRWIGLNQNSVFGPTLLTLVAACALIYFSMRLVTLFPAIATDASSDLKRYAWNASAGNVFRLFMSLLLIILPFGVGLLFINYIFGEGFFAPKLHFIGHLVSAIGAFPIVAHMSNSYLMLVSEPLKTQDLSKD